MRVRVHVCVSRTPFRAACFLRALHVSTRLVGPAGTVASTPLGFLLCSHSCTYCAVICEQFRFKHFAPFGIPHATTQATTLQGYNIPKGAQVKLNPFPHKLDCARRTAAAATWPCGLLRRRVSLSQPHVVK